MGDLDSEVKNHSLTALLGGLVIRAEGTVTNPTPPSTVEASCEAQGTVTNPPEGDC
jgi:hypothetical protein